MRPVDGDRNGRRVYYDLDRGPVPRSLLAIEDGRNDVWAATWPHYDTVEEARTFYSPLEGDMLAALRYYRLEPELQVEFGRYRVDFLFRRQHVVVEVDGRGFHDWSRDRERDAYLRKQHDLIVRRFSGRDVYRNPLGCAINVRNAVVWVDQRLHRVCPA